MKRRFILIYLVLVLVLLTAVPSMAAGNKGPAEGIVSVRAITDSVVMGQKLAAVVVEYQHNVDASKLALDTFTVNDQYYDTTFIDATITAVYTNKTPEMRANKTSVKGKYVIIEIDPFDRVGYMVNYYTDPVTGEKEQYWLKPDVTATVKQNADIYKDIGKGNGKGQGKSKAMIISNASPEWLEMTKKTVHLKFDEFKTITIKSSVNVDAQGSPLDILSYYYLPKGYKQSHKEYAIVFVQCGAGLRYWEKLNSRGELINNAGACIAFDQSATAWVRNGYEDVIVVSVDYRGKYAPAGYNGAADINQVAEYFIANFKVDANRLYYSGNSMGAMTGYNVMKARPDLWAAFMPCNGLSSMGRIDTPEQLQAYKDAVAANLIPLAENSIAVCYQIGYDDGIAPGPKAQLHYDFMYDYYKAQGMSDEDIAEILDLNLYYMQQYYDAKVLADNGQYNAHLATKLAYTIDKQDFMPWMLSQSK